MKTKKRVKTNILLILSYILILLLPYINTIENKTIKLLYCIIQFMLLLVLSKRYIKGNF